VFAKGGVLDPLSWLHETRGGRWALPSAGPEAHALPSRSQVIHDHPSGISQYRLCKRPWLQTRL